MAEEPCGGEWRYDRRVRLKRKSATAAMTTMMRMVHNMVRTPFLACLKRRNPGLGVASHPNLSRM